MWNGMAVYLTVSFIFLAGAGFYMYQFNQLNKSVQQTNQILQKILDKK